MLFRAEKQLLEVLRHFHVKSHFVSMHCGALLHRPSLLHCCLVILNVEEGKVEMVVEVE